MFLLPSTHNNFFLTSSTIWFMYCCMFLFAKKKKWNKRYVRHNRIIYTKISQVLVCHIKEKNIKPKHIVDISVFVSFVVTSEKYYIKHFFFVDMLFAFWLKREHFFFFLIVDLILLLLLLLAWIAFSNVHIAWMFEMWRRAGFSFVCWLSKKIWKKALLFVYISIFNVNIYVWLNDNACKWNKI